MSAWVRGAIQDRIDSQNTLTALIARLRADLGIDRKADLEALRKMLTDDRQGDLATVAKKMLEKLLGTAGAKKA